jgi:hypothetical protein
MVIAVFRMLLYRNNTFIFDSLRSSITERTLETATRTFLRLVGQESVVAEVTRGKYWLQICLEGGIGVGRTWLIHPGFTPGLFRPRPFMPSELLYEPFL